MVYKIQDQDWIQVTAWGEVFPPSLFFVSFFFFFLKEVKNDPVVNKSHMIDSKHNQVIKIGEWNRVTSPVHTETYKHAVDSFYLLYG